MPSTRSHKEWLAETRRRGECIRRRRRTLAALVGAVALALPVFALATLVGGATDRELRLAAAGAPPAPAGTTVTTQGPPDAGSADESTAPTIQNFATPTTVPERPEPGTRRPAPSAGPDESENRRVPLDGSSSTTSTSVPRAGDPPSSTTSTSAPGGGGPPSNVASIAAASPASPPVRSTLEACRPEAVVVGVTTEKSTYAPGETVSGASTIENRSATACLLPTRAFVRIDDGDGASVGGFAYTTEYRLPVRAEPGQRFTSGFTWDQRNCSGSPCVPARIGAYVVVAEWTEGGSYVGRSSFEVGVS